ncbi:acyl-CoA thioesterase [Halobacillus litoralis]|uniref:acyl-CoA thioesterase n=1 Tax=Halobacillus litoralis TaxID=45668 RepID=UPI001CFDC284|nr:thioesterase family protein [Halobacillus litoralis]
MRVRFCETDMAGHVNNTSYFIYLEEARGKFFQEVFPPHLNTGSRFILASTTCDFVSQAYYGQSLIIRSWISKVGTSSFNFSHSILVEDTKEEVAKASAVLVQFDYEKQQSAAIDGELRELLEVYLDVEKVRRG